MRSRWDSATCGWSRRVFHYPLPTLMSRNFRLPCTIELQPLSLTPLKMHKVELIVCLGIGMLPLTIGGLHRLVMRCPIGMFTAAVHRQGVDAHVHAAHRLGFSIGRCDGRFPIRYAGVPATVALSDRGLVGYALRQRASHTHTAQVGQPNAPVAVVSEARHSRGG